MSNYNRILLIFNLLTAVMAVLLIMPEYVRAQGNPTFEKIFYYSGIKAGIKSLQNNAAKIDIFAPQVYSVNSNLKPSGGMNKEIKAIVAKKGIKVMPLIVNQGFNQKIIHNLLVSSKARKAVIAYMIGEAKKNNYIGWQLDFEHINYKDRDRYTAFVEEAANEFEKSSLLLSVAAVARKNDSVNNYYKNWSGAFDYEKIAQSADFISIMAYDDPNSLGPVASLPYVKEVLSYLAGKVPENKLSLGVPLYNWDWGKTTKRAVGYGVLQTIRKNYVCKEDFDLSLGVAWISYNAKGQKRKVWCEDERSFELKMDLVREKKLRGISAWVLGFEDPDIWSKF